MPITEEYQLIFTKTQKRTVAADRITKQIATMQSVITKSREVQGYGLVPNPTGQDGKAWTITGDPKNGYQFELFLTLRYHNEENKNPDKNVVDSILNGLQDVASKPTTGLWTLSMVGDQEFEPFDAETVGRLADTESMEYVKVSIPENIMDYFSDMYGLDDHIERLLSAVRAGVYSDFEDRCHIVLVGPPGCGKTTLVEKLMSAPGEDAFVTFDRTATTGAGAIKELDEVEILPHFMFLDEGEKTTDTASNFLLSLTDDRAEIHKVTARKKIQRQIKLMAIACVNDEEDWKKLCKGALADRFGEPIYFNRPDHAMLRRILEREVVKVPGGSDAWIEPCLKYCLNRGWDRPRKLISLLKQGREAWLDSGPKGFAAIMDRTTKRSQDEVIQVTDWSEKK